MDPWVQRCRGNDELDPTVGRRALPGAKLITGFRALEQLGTGKDKVEVEGSWNCR